QQIVDTEVDVLDQSPASKQFMGTGNAYHVALAYRLGDRSHLAGVGARRRCAEDRGGDPGDGPCGASAPRTLRIGRHRHRGGYATQEADGTVGLATGTLSACTCPSPIRTMPQTPDRSFPRTEDRLATVTPRRERRWARGALTGALGVA